MAFQPVPKPSTKLGYYRLLAPSAGVRVSPLCLGAMNFGDAWKGFMGECDKKQSFEILDTFYEAGGNFIDTANNYQNEESELWVGEWMQARGNRDEMVLATKYTTCYPTPSKKVPIRANYQGNHTKSLHLSVEASLKKLQTSYIDILYLHWWDTSTSIPELMQSLHHLVMSGKILYLGISDTPAWIVAQANQYARDHALTQFCVYQGLWNASVRDFEREILPMCENNGMGLAPWGALGRGQFKLPEDLAKHEGGRKSRTEQSERDIAIVKVLDRIAKEKSTRITSIAMAYVRQKSAYVFPIVGCRNVDHLKSNIEALSIELSDKEILDIENSAPYEHGFPHSMLAMGIEGASHTETTPLDNMLVKAAAHIDIVARPKAPRTRAD